MKTDTPMPRLADDDARRTSVASLDKLTMGCIARAALKGVVVHIMDAGDFVVLRGAFQQRVHGRGELATALRLLGVEAPDAP